MTLMGSKYPQPDSLSEFLKMHGGSSQCQYGTVPHGLYPEVENDALEGRSIVLPDSIAALLLDKNTPTVNALR